MSLLKDEHGWPITRQDPRATKLHPVTGEPVPDPDAKQAVYRFVSPRPASWPEADFIVGNPPFIGAKDLRAELGDGYAEALWASRRKKSDSIDFVMYWWDHAATILRAKGSHLRRFGFITTNSITQKFSRRVLEKHLKAPKDRGSLVFAVPDHPWVKTGKGLGKKAQVRIAMTVAERGQRAGKLAEVVEEKGHDTDQPTVRLRVSEGILNPDLSIGIDLTGMPELRAAEGVSSPGVKLHGDGFIISPQEASALGLGRVSGLEPPCFTG
ncbi:MAG TPA: DNA methyltransferase [Beijerinckiaceae bacterium]|nr:DNA methyltransferase [Beijerinckiaceae bacterium]